MSNERLDRMRQLLKPISHERAQEIMEERTRPRVQYKGIVNPLGIAKVVEIITSRRDKRVVGS